MFSSFLISFLAVVSSYLARYDRCKYGLEFSFILLTLFLSIRYDWGNDYIPYLERFQYFTQLADLSIEWISFIMKEADEAGWIILNLLFSPIGFFSLVIFLTIIENYILYYYIKKYVPIKWYWFSVFLYTFTSTYMLTCSSMMRQYVSMSIFLIAIKSIIKGNLLTYILLISIAVSFHVSAIILYPIYLVRYINFSINNKLTFYIGVVFIIIWFLYIPSIFNSLLDIIFNMSVIEKYHIYMDSSESVSRGGSVILNIILFIQGLCCVKYLERNYQILLYITLISILIIPFTYVIPLISRLSIYFGYLSIFIYPIILCKTRSKLLKKSLMILLIIFSLKLWHTFFYSETWHDSFFYYKTIFSAPYWM